MAGYGSPQAVMATSRADMEGLGADSSGTEKPPAEEGPTRPMSANPVGFEPGRNEDLLVRDWRALQLQRLGLSWLLARRFADVVDWHEVAELVERGCTPELALRIVR